ncbi:24243_t:CDS:2 [Entrophospora sp. SA101]|nr:4888_t:CDS:2 [Entrophospora sp. SA101]CAJ0756798.1 24243_t:CDS:2 [Entrophospora sp. SA101]CAJ0840332.1 9273_t:CDS:2 [Entrophospora sp. SA101]CAJ0897359.1 8328_t:CDS:2 [Entrophospora sp. SA101]
MQFKNAIYVTGADSRIGSSIVDSLVEMQNLYLHLQKISVYAGISHQTIRSSTILEKKGTIAVEVDPVNKPEAVIHALNNVSKLLLLVDPLGGEITRNDAFTFAKGYINAAKEANVEHIETFQPSQITILRYPGVLHQHLLYFAKYIIEQSTIPLIDNPQMTFECCDINDVARSCCHILYCPTQRHGGKEYKITGPNLLTIDEIGSKASLGLGCDIKIKLMPVNQLRQVLMDLTADDKLAAYLLELWGLQGYLGISRKLQVTRDLELITGGSGSNLREFFENNKIAFNQQE